MALKITITVGADRFEADGEFVPDDAFLKVVETWTRALGPPPDQDDIDALANQLRSQNDALAGTVREHPVTPAGNNILDSPG